MRCAAAADCDTYAKAMKYFKLMFRKYDAVNGVVQENVGAIRVVKAFVREDYEDEKFSGAANALFKNSISAERIISLSMPIMQLTVYACILSISCDRRTSRD